MVRHSANLGKMLWPMSPHTNILVMHACTVNSQLAVEDVRRKQETEERRQRRDQKRQQKVDKMPKVVEVSTHGAPSNVVTPELVKPPTGPIAFVFPGQGSQAIGMLKANFMCPKIPASGLMIFCSLLMHPSIVCVRSP